MSLEAADAPPVAAASAAADPPAARPASPGRPSRSVLYRLLAVAVAAVVVVHLLSALVIATATSRSLERRLDERLSAILDSRAKLMAAPLWKMQYENLIAVLQEMVSDRTIVSGVVRDDVGAIVAATDPPGAPGRTITRSRQIVYRDGNIRALAGRLEVTFTRAPIAAAFWQSLWEALLIALMATCAISVGIWMATQKYIGEPLTLIADAIERSRLDGKRHRVRWKSDDEFGAVAKAFNAMQDAAERSEYSLHVANRRLDFLALHDELTGLPNRRSFEERLRRAANATDGATGTLAVHFIDLDDFKGINDTLGHAAGDKVLRQVGEQLRAVVREDDFVARFGGDEFVVLQTRVRTEENARAFAERLIEAIGNPCTVHDHTVRTGASVGIAMLEGDASEVVRLLSLADIALYDAKRTSRGTISFLTSAAREEHNRRRRMEADLKTALDEGQFVLHFQPQVSLQSARTVGLEALVRWRHPLHGLMSPAEFLPLVEDLGLGTRLGAQVIDAACLAARELRDRGHHHIRVAVNLSAAQIVDRDLVTLFEDRIAEFRLPPSALEVEITEGALIRDPHNAEIVLTALRRLGISTALDDFGTGYSSLAYLRRFPIDRIKLDRSFVRELPEIEETAAIVRAIRGLARALGVEICAEGIERDVETTFLRAEGIQAAQGYLYCRPGPLPDILAWLGRRESVAWKAA